MSLLLQTYTSWGDKKIDRVEPRACVSPLQGT